MKVDYAIDLLKQQLEGYEHNREFTEKELAQAVEDLATKVVSYENKIAQLKEAIKQLEEKTND